MNARHRVVQVTHIPKPFGAEPGCVLPAEAFAKCVVWCRDVPVAIHVRRVNGALRPIRLPLGHLYPHHCCKNQGKQCFQYLPGVDFRNLTRFGLSIGIVDGIDDRSLLSQARTGIASQ